MENLVANARKDGRCFDLTIKDSKLILQARERENWLAWWQHRRQNGPVYLLDAFVTYLPFALWWFGHIDLLPLIMWWFFSPLWTGNWINKRLVKTAVKRGDCSEVRHWEFGDMVCPDKFDFFLAKEVLSLLAKKEGPNFTLRLIKRDGKVLQIGFPRFARSEAAWRRDAQIIAEFLGKPLVFVD